MSRPLAECAALGLLNFWLCAKFWPKPLQISGFEIGIPSAWILSALSLAALLKAIDVSPSAFWWAWGGGLALRVAALVALMVLSWGKPPAFAAALLLSYVFGIIIFLPVEFRHLKASPLPEIAAQ